MNSMIMDVLFPGLFDDLNGVSFVSNHVSVYQFLAPLESRLAVDRHKAVFNGILGVYSGFH